MKKARARRKFLAKRDKIIGAARERAQAAIEENIFSVGGFFDAEDYFIYLSFGSEVATNSIISALLSRGKRIYVPKICEGKMLAVKISGGMKINSFGIAEPVDTVKAEKIDVCVTPLAAADKQLRRVGYGKGYYDKFFAVNDCVKIGVCFSAQVSQKEIETESTDVPLDILVTEKGVLKREK